MSLQAMEWAYRQEVSPSARKFVLVTLANYADGDGFCFPGQDTLAKMTGQDERSVRNHLANLEADGLIRREHRQRKNGSRKSDGIYLEMPVPTGKDTRKESPIQPERTPGRPTGKDTRKELESNRKVLQGQPESFAGQPENSSALELKAFELKALEPSPTSDFEPDSEPDLETTGDVDDVQNPSQDQNPTPTRSSTGPRLTPPAKLGGFNPQPKPVPSQAQDEITRTGLEDVPGGASGPSPIAPRDQAINALKRILSAPRNIDQQQHIPAWLEAHPLEYVLEVIAEITNGDGVKTSGVGLLITALNTPGSSSVPDRLRLGLKRSRAGLTFTLERKRGWYRLANNRHEHVERWDADGIAHTLEGKFAPAMTRMWDRMPDDWTPDDHLEQPAATNDVPDRISPARAAELAAEFRNRHKPQEATR